MDKKITKYIKIIITVAIIALLLWFLVLSPFITFKRNEKKLEQAARRYYELNSDALPTGERLATVDLKTLYYKSFIKEDFYIPNTKEPCSVTDSWVKVKRVNGEYKYYTYLKCGVLSSNIDHKGPEITLNGKDEIIVNKGEKYQDPGVASVIDNTDGKMKPSSVTIKSKVDTSKIGTYEVTYTALDNLRNKTTVTRKVKVVERLKNTVKASTNNVGYYVGNNPNNYIYFSGMLFRIIGIDGDNIRIIADKDIANVNYKAIGKWLDDYYYEHLSTNAKKLIVENKYCNMALTNTTLDTTECTSYTKTRKVYIPSITDINKATTNDGNYLKPATLSWTANKVDNKTAYVTRNYFFQANTPYATYDQTFNFGVRPILTIKGNTLIKDGNGTKENPYSLGELKPAKASDLVNTRQSGEYLKYSGMLWRIVEVEDGLTKIIADQTLHDKEEKVTYSYQPNNTIYNPKQKNNVAHSINNKATEFVDTSYFVNHEVKVPIYKNKIQYKEEVDTKKYTVKLFVPNMYEMFSAYNGDVLMKSTWLLNSSKETNMAGAMTDIGVPVNEKIGDYDRYGVRPVAYLNEKVAISTGKGTKENPYTITK